MRTGVIYAALSFLIWGLFPLYFHALNEVPPFEILIHRVLWSLLFLALVLTYRRQWKWLPELIHKPKTVASFCFSSLLLSGNWLLYIWAVNSGHVIESSLGYFINPLFNVMLGYVVLKEKLRPGQWAAVGLAALGVAWLAFDSGRLPWIALLLAASFGGYGLMRKTAALGPLEGLSFETMLLFPIALIYLVWLTVHGESSFVTTSADSTRWLLAAAGPITAIPLLLFAAGARRIPLSVLGLLQYIGPTIQFSLGVLLFHEAFTRGKLIGFVMIWSALAMYAAEGLWKRAQPA